MESNKDEAIKCLAIAQKHRNAGNLASAKRFCHKSLSLFATPEGTKLLEVLEVEIAEQPDAAEPSSSSASSSAGASTAFSSSAEAHPSSAGTRHRHTESSAQANGKANGKAKVEEKKRDYTPEQAAMVKRIRACKVTEYYEILSLKKDCEEAEVKKAYRKLALGLHPDKNGAPGADEAFKMVSKAFQVLSDPQKRAAYDQHGSDPESRFGGGGQPSFSRATSNFGGTPFGQSFEGEMSPEDLFNMFFGGGMGPGGSFGGGPMFSASFGPGGFRTTRVRTNAQQQQRQNAEPRSIFVQLLPLFILFGFSLLNALPSLFSTPPTPDPRFSFSATPRYNVERTTNGLGIKYHVNAAEFSGHPIAAELARTERKPGPELKKFESNVERAYTSDLYARCQRGVDQKERRKNLEVGMFGIGTDWEKVRRIDAEPIESCDELRKLGLLH
ncbi:DnaJ-domain-containing protein [Phanerochaete sordida]|uniref:DnaJ-domain-containing protein n=1 Tax=Phanerochaete sordida TaxID=48140 RepID=A0A9P3GBE6_9APHY|nr:DnaJ-domain-containing protein [Phanerochaete sordida]